MQDGDLAGAVRLAQIRQPRAARAACAQVGAEAHDGVGRRSAPGQGAEQRSVAGALVARLER